MASQGLERVPLRHPEAWAAPASPPPPPTASPPTQVSNIYSHAPIYVHVSALDSYPWHSSIDFKPSEVLRCSELLQLPGKCCLKDIIVASDKEGEKGLGHIPGSTFLLFSQPLSVSPAVTSGFNSRGSNAGGRWRLVNLNAKLLRFPGLLWSRGMCPREGCAVGSHRRKGGGGGGDSQDFHSDTGN